MDTWINGFVMNMVCFDEDAKELVQVSNGRCILPHDKDAYDGHMGDGRGCQYAPHEAIALRPLACTGKRPRFHVAWTYRGVRAAALREVKPESAEAFKHMLHNAKAGRV